MTMTLLDKPAKAGKKKLRVGWFCFSCCEDSTIIFTEMMNDYYDKWKNVIDIRYMRALRKNNDMNDLDVAFVEGAISTDEDAEKVKEIRENAKKLVAIGSCAVTGMPSAQRNNFDEYKKREIYATAKAFKLRSHVSPLHEIVKVDEKVPGCPMVETAFLKTLGKYIKEFGIDA